MSARGFPKRWTDWLSALWTSSSSRVYINGEYSQHFLHKRGLRQRDPLSPMLFNIAVDVFQKMIQVANSLLNSPLSNRLQDLIMALQYADDTVVLASAEISSLISFKLILCLFSSISGLLHNFKKSSFIPINVAPLDLPWVKSVMGCPQTNFPIVYLGMPISIKRPNKEHFIPLIEKIERRMQGWQSRLLSRGGRLVLVQTVLSSIPTYHMICFIIPKWVLSRIDKARRAFLWGNSEGGGQHISLCNWNLVCIPKEWGGIGTARLAPKELGSNTALVVEELQ